MSEIAVVSSRKARLQRLGGFVMHTLERIPAATDRFEAAGLSFEVVDMDKNRVDKVLVTRLPPPEPTNESD